MTGPEHYREAERLLSDASFVSVTGTPVTREGIPMQPEHRDVLIARAMVHAKLADIAAHVSSQPLEAHTKDSSGFGEEDWDEWQRAFDPTTSTTDEEN